MPSSVCRDPHMRDQLSKRSFYTYFLYAHMQRLQYWEKTCTRPCRSCTDCHVLKSSDAPGYAAAKSHQDVIVIYKKFGRSVITLKSSHLCTKQSQEWLQGSREQGSRLALSIKHTRMEDAMYCSYGTKSFHESRHVSPSIMPCCPGVSATLQIALMYHSAQNH
jgi:hypothetical protein